MVLCMKKKVLRETEMTMQSKCKQQFNTIATVVGFMPASWLAINSLSHGDRTPEGIYPQGLIREGWDG